MDLKLTDGSIIALNVEADKDSVIVTSTKDGSKVTEVVFFSDGRKYFPSGSMFAEMR